MIEAGCWNPVAKRKDAGRMLKEGHWKRDAGGRMLEERCWKDTERGKIEEGN